MALTARIFFLLLSTFLIIFGEGAEITSTTGKEFVFGFIGQTSSRRHTILIDTLQESPDVQVTLRIPALDITEYFSVSKTQNHVFEWPDREDVTYEPIIITATSDIFVYAQTTSTAPNMLESFTPLPTSSLGTQYHLVSEVGGCNPAEFLIISIGDGQTRVTLSNWPAGFEDPVTITLDPFEKYFFAAGGGGDFTGLKVTATKPVAVISGASCSFVPMIGNMIGSSQCELLVEMIPDVESYGRHFVMASVYPRRSGFEYRVIASQDDTTFSVTSSTDDSVITKSINAGEFYIGDSNQEHEMIIVRSAKPILVAQYTKSSRPPVGFADDISEAAMLIIPSVEHWSSGDIAFTTNDAGGIDARVSITSLCCDQDGLRVDGSPLPTPEATYTYDNMCTTQLNLGIGVARHTIGHEVDGAKFFAFAYGTGRRFPYAYPLKYNVHVQLDVPSLSQAPTVYPLLDQQVSISWQSWGSSELDTGDGPMANYRIDYRDITKDTWVTAGVLPLAIPCGNGVPLTTYSYTMSSLDSGTYEFGVSAVGSGDRLGPRSPASAVIEIHKQ